MNYLLAIDQGTSSTRARVYTSQGKLVATCQHPITQHYPQSGWVEHCPEEIWTKTLMAIESVVSEVGVENILACGITNQRETTVIWDKQTGECLHRAIVWQDRRTEAFCEDLDDARGMIKEKTGLRPDPYFSASKLHWLLSNIPQAQALVKKKQLAFGTIDSFLIWRLTKGRSHFTDVTNASRTLLFNIVTRKWDAELLTLFNIPESVLPEVKACDAAFGFIDKHFFGKNIPITGVAGDQQAALIGQHCFYNGMIKATFGTGGFLLMNTGDKIVSSSDHLLTTIAYQIQGHLAYGLEGSIYQAGTTIKWLRDELKLITSAAETENLSASLDNNEGVYLIPSFTGLGAPHWISSPGAIITGLSLKSNPAHFARAALESVCYQTRELIECMREESNMDLSLLRVDGGMAANQWFLQFLANQSQLVVQKPFDIETTALGVALLAGIGCGEIKSLDSICSSESREKEYCPQGELKQHEKDFSGWLDALKRIK